ncbi:MAG: hypothetical protein LRY30_01735 [Gammaproteobacteria bacterium]|nr:hypothetical protein [Gammaproteobacteria bacterium]
MAKALREFAVTEIGVDLGHYRTLFDNHIRPKAYRSHVAKKKRGRRRRSIRSIRAQYCINRHGRKNALKG